MLPIFVGVSALLYFWGANNATEIAIFTLTGLLKSADNLPEIIKQEVEKLVVVNIVIIQEAHEASLKRNKFAKLGFYVSKYLLPKEWISYELDNLDPQLVEKIKRLRFFWNIIGVEEKNDSKPAS